MMKQGLSFFLILMILITPIASALENCSAMDMSVHLLDNQSVTTMPTENHRLLEHKNMLQAQNDNQIDMDCHASNTCSLHACGGYGITSKILTVNTVISSLYSNYEYSSPYSTTLSADLRPPIFIL